MEQNNCHQNNGNDSSIGIIDLLGGNKVFKNLGFRRDSDAGGSSISLILLLPV